MEDNGRANGTAALRARRQPLAQERELGQQVVDVIRVQRGDLAVHPIAHSPRRSGPFDAQGAALHRNPR